MTGNAIEEYLLTKLDYPGHNDAGRFAGLAGSAVAIATGLTVKLYLGAALGIVAGVAAGLGLGALIFRWLTRRAEAREVKRRTEERERQEAETERRIAEMKAGQ